MDKKKLQALSNILISMWVPLFIIVVVNNFEFSFWYWLWAVLNIVIGVINLCLLWKTDEDKK